MYDGCCFSGDIVRVTGMKKEKDERLSSISNCNDLKNGLKKKKEISREDIPK